MFAVILKSLIIGAIAGFAIAAGAARMFHAPEVQAMGAFRTLGEMNACQGDPVAHFSFGLGFLLNAAGSMVGAGIPYIEVIPDDIEVVFTENPREAAASVTSVPISPVRRKRI